MACATGAGQANYYERDAEMATEQDNSSTSTTDSTTDETSGDQSQQQQTTTSETEGNGQSAAATVDDSTQLPESHPLVKSLSALKSKVAEQKQELSEARAQSATATKLQEELDKRPTQEALDTLQTRYDRLEAFLQAAGGPLGKALDSRSFTRDLFESDKDIADLVKEWHRANPSATSTALGSKAAAPAEGKMDPNKLIRIAAGKS